MISSACTPNYAGHQVPNIAILLKLANIEPDTELHFNGYHQPDIRQAVPAIHIACGSGGGDCDAVIVEDLSKYAVQLRQNLIAIHVLNRNVALSFGENAAVDRTRV
jgi:hypothetical protein